MVKMVLVKVRDQHGNLWTMAAQPMPYLVGLTKPDEKMELSEASTGPLTAVAVTLVED